MWERLAVRTAVVMASILWGSRGLAFEESSEVLLFSEDRCSACGDEACDDDARGKHCGELRPNECTSSKASVLEDVSKPS